MIKRWTVNKQIYDITELVISAVRKIKQVPGELPNTTCFIGQ